MENSADNYRNNSKKEKSCVFSVLAFVHCAGWILFGLVFIVFFMFSVRADLFSAYLKSNAVLILSITALVCAFSPLYLWRIRKKLLKYLIVYGISAAYLAFILILSSVSTNYYSDFTKEKWLEYPQFRSYMLDDLKENHGLIGMDDNGVTDLLGAPDSKNTTQFIYYVNKQDRVSMFIEIKFQDERVVSAIYMVIS